jgi:hypothetical protein
MGIDSGGWRDGDEVFAEIEVYINDLWAEAEGVDAEKGKS